MPEEIALAVAQAINNFGAGLDFFVAKLPAGFLPDVLRIFAGSFAGAGLALFLALRAQRAARRREQKAAGSLAVTTLARLANDFAQARAVLLNYRERVAREQPRLPLWMHIKPARFAYAESLRFELGSLAFLHECEGGTEAVELLIAAENAYHDFFGLLREYGVAHEALQWRTPAPVAPQPDAVRPPELSGPAGVPGRATALAHAILGHVERSDAVFRKASAALPGVLSRRFGKRGIAKITIPSYINLRKAVELSEEGLRTPPIRP